MQQIRDLLKEIENNASMIEVLVENLISDARQEGYDSGYDAGYDRGHDVGWDACDHCYAETLAKRLGEDVKN